MSTKTWIHCMGRHLEAKFWPNHMWIGPGGRLGQVPTALLIAHHEKADTLSFGTGASHRDGKKEAAWTRDFAATNLASLLTVGPFISIDLGPLGTLVATALLDEQSQNTEEEIVELGSKCLTNERPERVFLVTNPCHAPRVRRDLDVRWGQDVRLAELRRRTYVVSSEVPFDGVTAKDTAIFEPPHRGDDESPPYYKLVARILGIPKPNRHPFASELGSLLDKFGS